MKRTANAILPLALLAASVAGTGSVSGATKASGRGSRKLVPARHYSPEEQEAMRANCAEREARWKAERRAKSVARGNAKAMGLTGKGYRKWVKKQRQANRAAAGVNP